MESWHLTSPTSLYTLLKYPTWLSGVNFSPAGLIIFFQVIIPSGKRSRTARPIVEIEAVVLDCASVFSLMLLEVLEGLHFISSWTKSSFGSASLFGSPLAAAWRGRFSPVWQKVFHTFETGNTAYFVLWSYRSKTSWVVLCWNIPASTQNINDLISFSIDFLRWKGLSYSFISKQTCSTRWRNIMPRDQTERSKWSRKQAQNLILHIFSHNYSMFRDVPCSGFYRRPFEQFGKTLKRIDKRLNGFEWLNHSNG